MLISTQYLINTHLHGANPLHLLGLTAELRNNIMEMALHDPDEIKLTATSPVQPAILRVCSQLRQDHIGVYYDINEFHLVINDYDAAAIVPPIMAFVTYRKEDKSLARFMMNGFQNWGNLMEWLRLTHQDCLPRITIPDQLEEFVIVSQMFAIMEEMRKIDWTTTKKVLETFREPLGDVDVDWLGDPLEDGGDEEESQEG